MSTKTKFIAILIINLVNFQSIAARHLLSQQNENKTNLKHKHWRPHLKTTNLNLNFKSNTNNETENTATYNSQPIKKKLKTLKTNLKIVELPQTENLEKLNKLNKNTNNFNNYTFDVEMADELRIKQLMEEIILKSRRSIVEGQQRNIAKGQQTPPTLLSHAIFSARNNYSSNFNLHKNQIKNSINNENVHIVDEIPLRNKQQNNHSGNKNINDNQQNQYERHQEQSRNNVNEMMATQDNNNATMLDRFLDDTLANFKQRHNEERKSDNYEIEINTQGPTEQARSNYKTEDNGQILESENKKFIKNIAVKNLNAIEKLKSNKTNSQVQQIDKANIAETVENEKNENITTWTSEKTTVTLEPPTLSPNSILGTKIVTKTNANKTEVDTVHKTGDFFALKNTSNTKIFIKEGFNSKSDRIFYHRRKPNKTISIITTSKPKNGIENTQSQTYGSVSQLINQQHDSLTYTKVPDKGNKPEQQPQNSVLDLKRVKPETPKPQPQQPQKLVDIKLVDSVASVSVQPKPAQESIEVSKPVELMAPESVENLLQQAHDMDIKPLNTLVPELGQPQQREEPLMDMKPVKTVAPEPTQPQDLQEAIVDIKPVVVEPVQSHQSKEHDVNIEPAKHPAPEPIQPPQTQESVVKNKIIDSVEQKSVHPQELKQTVVDKKLIEPEATGSAQPQEAQKPVVDNKPIEPFSLEPVQMEEPLKLVVENKPIESLLSEPLQKKEPQELVVNIESVESEIVKTSQQEQPQKPVKEQDEPVTSEPEQQPLEQDVNIKPAKHVAPEPVQPPQAQEAVVGNAIIDFVAPESVVDNKLFEPEATGSVQPQKPQRPFFDNKSIEPLFPEPIQPQESQEYVVNTKLVEPGFLETTQLQQPTSTEKPVKEQVELATPASEQQSLEHGENIEPGTVYPQESKQPVVDNKLFEPEATVPAQPQKPQKSVVDNKPIEPLFPEPIQPQESQESVVNTKTVEPGVVQTAQPQQPQKPVVDIKNVEFAAPKPEQQPQEHDVKINPLKTLASEPLETQQPQEPLLGYESQKHKDELLQASKNLTTEDFETKINNSTLADVGQFDQNNKEPIILNSENQALIPINIIVNKEEDNLSTLKSVLENFDTTANIATNLDESVSNITRQNYTSKNFVAINQPDKLLNISAINIAEDPNADIKEGHTLESVNITNTLSKPTETSSLNITYMSNNFTGYQQTKLETNKLLLPKTAPNLELNPTKNQTVNKSLDKIFEQDALSKNHNKFNNSGTNNRNALAVFDAVRASIKATETNATNQKQPFFTNSLNDTSSQVTRNTKNYTVLYNVKASISEVTPANNASPNNSSTTNLKKIQCTSDTPITPVIHRKIVEAKEAGINYNLTNLKALEKLVGDFIRRQLDELEDINKTQVLNLQIEQGLTDELLKKIKLDEATKTMQEEISATINCYETQDEIKAHNLIADNYVDETDEATLSTPSKKITKNDAQIHLKSNDVKMTQQAADSGDIGVTKIDNGNEHDAANTGSDEAEIEEYYDDIVKTTEAAITKPAIKMTKAAAAAIVVGVNEQQKVKSEQLLTEIIAAKPTKSIKTYDESNFYDDDDDDDVDDNDAEFGTAVNDDDVAEVDYKENVDAAIVGVNNEVQQKFQAIPATNDVDNKANKVTEIASETDNNKNSSTAQHIVAEKEIENEKNLKKQDEKAIDDTNAALATNIDDEDGEGDRVVANKKMDFKDKTIQANDKMTENSIKTEISMAAHQKQFATYGTIPATATKKKLIATNNERNTNTIQSMSTALVNNQHLRKASKKVDAADKELEVVLHGSTMEQHSNKNNNSLQHQHIEENDIDDGPTATEITTTNWWHTLPYAEIRKFLNTIFESETAAHELYTEIARKSKEIQRGQHIKEMKLPIVSNADGDDVDADELDETVLAYNNGEANGGVGNSAGDSVYVDINGDSNGHLKQQSFWHINLADLWSMLW